MDYHQDERQLQINSSQDSGRVGGGGVWKGVVKWCMKEKRRRNIIRIRETCELLRYQMYCPLSDIVV
jgi:hypothetical protein